MHGRAPAVCDEILDGTLRTCAMAVIRARGTAAALATASIRPTVATMCVVFGVSVRLVAPRGFEDHIEVASLTERLHEPRRVEVVRAEIVQDCPALLQERLDVEELKWPNALAEYTITGLHPAGAIEGCAFGTIEI
jgi:hypothetical protein